jgi:hypothetical protein
MFALISGLVVGGVLLWLAVKDIDFAAVGTALRDAQLGYIFPMLGALALNYWLKAVRWQHLLAPSTSVPVPARALLPSMMVGIGANSILPAHLGELVRVYLAGTEFRIAKTTLLTTLVLERLLDVLSERAPDCSVVPDRRRARGSRSDDRAVRAQAAQQSALGSPVQSATL